MNTEYRRYLTNAESRYKENKKLVLKLNKLKPKQINSLFNRLHDEAFDIIDCLECANCCKSISPSVKDNDIRRISKHLKMKPSILTGDYFLQDADSEYIMNKTPCPFLCDNNYCEIYEARPLACKGYPHTDHNKMNQILDLTLKNTKICPAVCHIFEELRTIL
jgi:uncharacterized protein